MEVTNAANSEPRIVKGWDKKIFAVAVSPDNAEYLADGVVSAMKVLDNGLSGIGSAGRRGDFTCARYGIGRGGGTAVSGVGQ